MTRMTVKLALAVAGLVLFLLGIRTHNEVLRWAGIGFVALAWLTRFWRPTGGGTGKQSET